MYFKYRNTLHTPQKMQKIDEIKNIPYFLPVVYNARFKNWYIMYIVALCIWYVFIFQYLPNRMLSMWKNFIEMVDKNMEESWNEHVETYNPGQPIHDIKEPVLRVLPHSDVTVTSWRLK